MIHFSDAVRADVKEEYKSMPKRSVPSSTEYEHARVIERPDGYYWVDESNSENGPFCTLAEAVPG